MTPIASHTPDLAQPDKPVLSLVIVNYNSWADVLRQVQALAQPLKFEKAGSRSWSSITRAPRRCPTPSNRRRPGSGSSISAENGGFSAGVNQGWKASQARWLLVLNPDVLTPAGLPRQVLDRIAAYESRPSGPPGIVGFALANPDGSPQPSVGHDPSLLRLLRGLFLPRKRRKYQPVSRMRSGPVPWVTGACMLVSVSLLESLGGMDEDFFLYYEEVALCVAARRLGHRVEFDPAVKVVHCHPLQNRELTPALRLITRHSQLLYFRKYKSSMQFQTLAHIIGLEAAARGLKARGPQAHANRQILDMARRMRKGELLRGPAIRDLAQQVARYEAENPESTHSAAPRPLADRAAAPLAAINRSIDPKAAPGAAVSRGAEAP